jgi:hypothetical protein
VFAKVTALGYYFRFFDFGNPYNTYLWANTVHLSAYDTTTQVFFDGMFIKNDALLHHIFFILNIISVLYMLYVQNYATFSFSFTGILTLLFQLFTYMMMTKKKKVYPNAAEETSLLSSASFIDLNQWLHIVVTVNATGTYKLYKNGDLNAVYANPSNAIPASATRNSNYIGKSNFYPQDAYFIGIFAYMQMWEVYIYIYIKGCKLYA